jgi:prolyl 4-hydroxylase
MSQFQNGSAHAATPELLSWAVSQLQGGCRPDDVLAAMRASGWQDDAARLALAQAQAGLLAGQQPGTDEAGPVAVPEPDLQGSPSTLWAGDRQVQVLLSLALPRVVVFGGLLSNEECDELVALAAPRMARSETVVHVTGGNEVNEARTSDGMFFGRAELPLCERIEQRIATLLNWPVENGEGLQVLHYRPGAEYRPHHDYFDPAQPGTPSIVAVGGQRVGTLVMYLNTPERGGGTTFPELGLEVAPVKGHAVFFSYNRPHPSTRTLHGGAPVLAGEKWVATKWMRERRFE